MTQPTLNAPVTSLWRHEIRPPLRSMKEIIAKVAEETGVTVEQIKGDSRLKHICRARHRFCWEAHQVRYSDGSHRHSLSAIGRFLADRDHTTALNSVRRWEKIKAKEAEDQAVGIAAE